MSHEPSVALQWLTSEQRQQLLSVIAHAQVILFSVDCNRKLTLIEGAFNWNSRVGSGDESGNGKASKTEELIGQNIYDVFRSRDPEARVDEVPPPLKPIEDILTGKTMEEVHEYRSKRNRWYRTRFVPVLGKKSNGGQ
jgi:hypothetical protein